MKILWDAVHWHSCFSSHYHKHTFQVRSEIITQSMCGSVKRAASWRHLLCIAGFWNILTIQLRCHSFMTKGNLKRWLSTDLYVYFLLYRMMFPMAQFPWLTFERNINFIYFHQWCLRNVMDKFHPKGYHDIEIVICILNASNRVEAVYTYKKKKVVKLLHSMEKKKQCHPTLHSIQGPAFPESFLVGHFPLPHHSCSYKGMIQGRAKKNPKKIKFEQNRQNADTLPVSSARSGRHHRFAGQQKHTTTQGPYQAESVTRCH